MSHYIKSRIWDFLLCLLCQIGVVFSALSGFELEDSLYERVPAVILILASADVILFIFAYNRITMFIGIGAGIAALAGVIIYASAGNIFEDEAAHSQGIALAVIVITAAAVFLLGRSRAGIVVLFLLGNIVNAGAYFLKFPVKGWAILIFVFAALLYFLYRNYYVTVLKVRAGKVKPASFIVQAGVIVLAAFALGAGIYEAVVKPLNPPTRELKLIEKFEDMELFKVLGITQMREMYDPDKVTIQQIDYMLYANRLNEQGENKDEEDGQTDDNAPEDPVDDLARDVSRYATSFFYFLFDEWGWAWILAAVILIIADLFILRYIRRRSWQNRVDSLDNREKIVNYYQYFLSRLSKLGYGKPASHTLYEYSDNIEHEMQAFSSGEVTFSKLTDLYVKTWYGHRDVSDQEAGLFRSFYEDFGKNAKKEVGFFKYCLKYFAL